MEKNNYDYLIAHKSELNWPMSDLYIYTKQISDQIPYSKYECDNKVYRFCNAYVAEMGIMWFINTYCNRKCEFVGNITHQYFHADSGESAADLRLDGPDGPTIEVKSGRHKVENFKFTDNRKHTATWVVFYDRYKKAVYLMDYKNKTYTKWWDLDITLPFPDR